MKESRRADCLKKSELQKANGREKNDMVVNKIIRIAVGHVPLDASESVLTGDSKVINLLYL